MVARDRRGPAAALTTSMCSSARGTDSERRPGAVIWRCGAMMAADCGGLIPGRSLCGRRPAHDTHAGALLLAALAYTYARKHADDPIFTFGTGKFGDLAGYTSAIVLAMISTLIAWESASRMFVPVRFISLEAIPIACLGLGVNVASAWLLTAGMHGHVHGHAQRRRGGEA